MNPQYRRSIRLAIAALALTLIATPPAFAQAERARAEVERQVAAGRFSGVVLVSRDGKPLFRAAWGLADREWNVANTPTTKFRIGSLTKQFTAAAILQLEEAGKLSLDDPIARYYPEAPAAWSKVTIRHLLTHRSGIPSYTAIPGFFSKQAHDARTPAEVVALTRDKPLEFAPGTKFAYDNTGYTLLGMVIEKVSGQGYSDYVKAHIFAPLGMADTGYDVSAEVLPMRARGYDIKKGQAFNADYIDMSLPYAAGALYSTVDDLATWVTALHGGKVIGAAALKAMFTDWGDGYGFGEFIGKNLGSTRYAHSGGINGFFSELDYFPDEHLTVAVLTNQTNTAPETIATKFAAAYLDAPAMPTTTATAP
ncbi:serine hydrolase domain-containing protein [Sphingomonas sp. AR_OL41]|uniref:serine hydrolase domain-containing protein n=1 Tax=Sphingomonas sp. AR_OL41 TaxID=3042729 RepID=UPI0024815991|nr:serine hydrolase domain-containing protein [Sphingomonas sp. AR_OL41]MDH7975275.1 serine hydrolase domain-containing protein [Sphingomonas sp. AR_OL41]